LKEGGVYYWYQNDHLGTPQKLIAQDGTVVWSAQYSAFGEAVVDVATITNNLRFPGQYKDAETELHYNYHRYYDPRVGRYLRIDPIGLDGGDVNLYAYVWNPISSIDPLGLSSRKAPGHAPGGPYHPPVSTRCDAGGQQDSCSVLLGKMQLIMKSISSHLGWIIYHPTDPKNAGHAEEIANLWRAYGRCLDKYTERCKDQKPKCDPDGPSTPFYSPNRLLQSPIMIMIHPCILEPWRPYCDYSVGAIPDDAIF
jgi:RHS repeat-associated protein